VPQDHNLSRRQLQPRTRPVDALIQRERQAVPAGEAPTRQGRGDGHGGLWSPAVQAATRAKPPEDALPASNAHHARSDPRTAGQRFCWPPRADEQVYAHRLRE
jgi:hypothetical protein